MNNAANSVVVLMWCLMIALSGARAATPPATAEVVREIAAEGSQDQLWVADGIRVEDATGAPVERTRVYSKAVLGEGWQRPIMIGAGVRDLSQRGTQLVALLKTGEWMFAWPEGRSMGPELPAGGEMVCMGSDGTTVRAVGRVAGGMARATSRPTTARVATEPTTQADSGSMVALSVTTAPATTGPVRLVLFRLNRSSWLAEAELPEGIPAGIERLSMTTVRGQVLVAGVVAGEAVIYQRAKGWTEIGRLRLATGSVIRAKVLDGGDRPIVWLAEATGAGMLFVGTGGEMGQWQKPVELRVQADLSLPTPRDMAVAAGRLQLIFAKGDQLAMQAFDWRTGEPRGKAEGILPGVHSAAEPKSGFWIYAGVMAVLLLLMFGSVKRRRETEETGKRMERIPLAPLGLRLAAGVVDIWPQWVAGVYLSLRTDVPVDLEASLSDPMIVRLGMIAMLVYILHTMVFEMFFAASIGKMIFGLRVTQLNGDRPGAGAIFVRNLMRAVDMGLVFVGVVMIVLSPLRQRIGDLAAGTIVVRRTTVGMKEESVVETPVE